MSYKLPKEEVLEKFATKVFLRPVKIIYYSLEILPKKLRKSVENSIMFVFSRVISLEKKEKCRFIFVNREILREQKYPLYHIKAMLLHEVGHLKNQPKKGSEAYNEFIAHDYAIRYAKNFKMKRELAALNAMLFDWASHDKRHLVKKAFLIGVKRGSWEAKYYQ